MASNESPAGSRSLPLPVERAGCQSWGSRCSSATNHPPCERAILHLAPPGLGPANGFGADGSQVSDCRHQLFGWQAWLLSRASDRPARLQVGRAASFFPGAEARSFCPPSYEAVACLPSSASQASMAWGSEERTGWRYPWVVRISLCPARSATFTRSSSWSATSDTNEWRSS